MVDFLAIYIAIPVLLTVATLHAGAGVLAAMHVIVDSAFDAKDWRGWLLMAYIVTSGVLSLIVLLGGIYVFMS